MYANLQSFLDKKPEIEIKIAEENFDLLFFTEIWITEQHHDCELFIPGFQRPVLDPRVRGVPVFLFALD